MIQDTACQQEATGTIVEMWMNVLSHPSTIATQTLLAPTAWDRSAVRARQAFKVYNAQKGQALTPKSVNGIGPTKDGIRDRVIVMWYTGPMVGGVARTYDGKHLEILEGQSEQS